MRALFALLLAGAAAPAHAQHAGHSGPVESPSVTSCTPEHAAMGHCTMPPPAQPADPPAGHQMPAQEQPQPAVDPHAGHDMGEAAAEVPVGAAPPEAFTGPEHAADRIWGRAAMEQGRAVLFTEHGDIPAYRVLFDQLEARFRKGRDGYFLNAEAWFGGDIDKLWLKTEIEGERGHQPDQAEVQALWSRAIDPWFNLQTGVRYDFRPANGTAHLVVGVQGLAPYWIEVDAAAFVSARGDVTARIEAEHDARITQKLILQPRLEADFALQDVRRESVGAGLSVAELGLRLRYQVTPQIAPYLGVEYDRAFGDTRRLRRVERERLGGLSFVTGLRLWF